MTGERTADLLGCLAQRDEAALSELYDLTGSRVYGLALHVLQDSALAEEVTLGIYTALWDGRITRPPGSANPLVWLLGVARKRAVDLRNDRQPESADRTLSVEGLIEPSGFGLPKEAGDSRAEGVRRALARLEPDERNAVTLAFFRGYSVTRIARHLELPVASATALLHRGFSALRRTLEESGVNS